MTTVKDPPPPYTEVPQYNQPTSVYPGAPPPGFYPAGPPQPAPGYYVPSAPGYGATSTTIVVENTPDVIIIGACPACRIGVLQDDFTCLGLLCAIFFFPIGILCCLAMREKRCSNCGATFG
ncbi:hypothetical protein ABEB36_000655 [Hypothenemus hampei]|uniref:Membrane protein BRI3 n=1 Tax=Hypothenemus hampei TaxID=57062 RepID=A0ABD1FCR7_HYPHA